MNKKILFVNVLVLGMAGVALLFYFTEYVPVTAINNACLELVNNEILDEDFEARFEEMGCSQVMNLDEIKKPFKITGEQFEELVSRNESP